MKEIFKNILDSFHNNEGGYSAKKLTIFSVVICVCVGHFKLYNSESWNQLFVPVITSDFAFILALFGINVADKKINTKPDNTNEVTN